MATSGAGVDKGAELGVSSTSAPLTTPAIAMAVVDKGAEWKQLHQILLSGN